MRLSAIARAAGQTLAHDVPPLTPGGPPLLRAGTTITPAHQRSLADAGVGEVWIADALDEGVDGVVVSVDPGDPERPWVRVPAPDGSHEVMVDVGEHGAEASGPVS